MNLDNLKITTYKDNVKDLPDYPSEKYSATELKEIFDGRTDEEVKDKHNALIDELQGIIAELETADDSTEQNAKGYADGIVSAHDTADASHSDIRLLIKDIRDYVEKLETELGVMENDTGSSVKAVKRANTAFYSDESRYANEAQKDGEGRIIHTTYATKGELSEHSGNKANPHEVTAAQIGAYTKKEVDDAIGDISFALDTKMSDTSENPVQNRVIKAYVDESIKNAILDSWEAEV